MRIESHSPVINPAVKVLIFAGAHVVQSLAKKLGLLLGDGPNYGIGKECDCVVLMLAHLYNYRVCSYFDNYLSVVFCDVLT